MNSIFTGSPSWFYSVFLAISFVFLFLLPKIYNPYVSTLEYMNPIEVEPRHHQLYGLLKFIIICNELYSKTWIIYINYIFFLGKRKAEPELLQNIHIYRRDIDKKFSDINPTSLTVGSLMYCYIRIKIVRGMKYSSFKYITLYSTCKVGRIYLKELLSQFEQIHRDKLPPAEHYTCGYNWQESYE